MLSFSMAHGFDDYRLFISAPGDMESDRQACYDAIAQADEATAMPAKILLVPVGLRENSQIEGSRSIVSDNVRWSSYFIQLFQDDWGPRDLFRKLFLLAIECRDDPAMPMRDVVVCLKSAPNETDDHVLAWRGELEERTDLRVIRYARLDELQARLEEVCTEWVRELIATRTESPRVSEG
jgi:hypothetical protein